MENAFGDGEGREIIEEYDEEKEHLWRIEHRKKLAAAKKLEAEERSSQEDNKNVMDVLDELELMEEFERELERLDVSTDDQLAKLLSGEIRPPHEKKRVAHGIVNLGKSTGAIPKQKMDSLEKDSKMEKDSSGFWDEILEMPETTSTEVPAILNDLSSDSGDEFNENVYSEQTQSHWKLIVEETKFLNIHQRRKYLKTRLKEVLLCLREIKITDQDTLATKIDLDDLRDIIEDELLRLEDAQEGSEGSEEEKEEEEEPPPEEQQEVKPKSRIKFATADSVKLIDKYEAPIVVSKPNFLELDPEMTVPISFQHTLYPAIPPSKTDSEEEDDSIASPLDIYKKFGHCLVDQQPKVDPILQLAETEAKKSILKNKEKVLEEKREVAVKKVARKKVKESPKVRFFLLK